ncbi:hypothetical protein SteCoe_26329 [Stentor coeruleus]|uniref:Uncharacterized protein n=1 Tax=Stentor coeruleus TaxID=5963 RepID=A0A1R2BD49_9CILI|nr:hypothetical protein SteCoe_26329 [Stentor coeruleus]
MEIKCGKCSKNCQCLIGNGLICHDCKFKGLEKDGNVAICRKHRNDYLEPNCHKKLRDKYCDAVAINLKNMTIYCQDHFLNEEVKVQEMTISKTLSQKSPERNIEENVQSLKDDFAIDILNKYIEQKDIRSKKIKNDLSAQQIYDIIKKKYLKNTNEFLCYKHVKKASKININTYAIKCEMCYIDQSDADQSDTDLNNENADEFYRSGVEKCKELNTASFGKNLILLLRKTEERDIKFYSFFFYCLNKALSKSSLKISEQSKCLICFRKFKLGQRIAVKIHEVLKHEICLKCYEKSNKCCPIDNKPFSSPPKIHIIPSFFNTRFPFCSKCLIKKQNNENVDDFSYYNKNYPYLLQCNSNQCKKCLDDINLFIECSCRHSSYHNKDVLNYDYIKNLKSLEMMCPMHNLTIKYCNMRYPIGYCDKCDRPALNQTNLRQNESINLNHENVDTPISERETSSSLTNSSNDTMIQIFENEIRKLTIENTLWNFRKICLDFLTRRISELFQKPISKLYEKIEHFKLNDLYSCCCTFYLGAGIETKRFSKILPMNAKSLNYWLVYSDNYFENFRIILPKKKFIRYILVGLVIGRCKTVGKIQVQGTINGEYKILCDDDVETADIANGKTTQNIYFSDIDLSEEVHISVCFTNKGMYCHGYFSVEESENFTKIFPTDLGVKIISENNQFGNQTYGGPIIGAIVSPIPSSLALEDEFIERRFLTFK